MSLGMLCNNLFRVLIEFLYNLIWSLSSFDLGARLPNENSINIIVWFFWVVLIILVSPSILCFFVSGVVNSILNRLTENKQVSILKKFEFNNWYYHIRSTTSWCIRNSLLIIYILLYRSSMSFRSRDFWTLPFLALQGVQNYLKRISQVICWWIIQIF